MLILISHMDVTKTGQKHMNTFYKKFFTTICDIKIDLIMCEPDFVKVFRWFKFTLKPPYIVAHENILAIWDISHWNFLSNLD